MISNQDYKQMRGRLNFKRRLSHNIGFFLVDAAFLVAAYHFIQIDSIGLYLVSQILLAIVFLHSFLFVHECGHNTLSQNKTVNVVIGHIYSIFCFMPFYTWKFIHEEHHKWTGHIDKDPVFALLKQAKEKKKLPWIFHFGWRSFIPLNVLFLHLIYWSYPLTLKRENKLTRFLFKHCLFSLVVLLVAYTMFYLFLPKDIGLLTILPAIVLYAVMWETLSTPQHLGLEPTKHRPTLKDHATTTRSTWFPFLIQRYLLMNFGYHIEHHFFPALPWHKLDKAHLLIQEKLGADYNLVTGGIWNIKMRSQNMETAIGVRENNG